MKAALGAAVVVAHALGFARLATHCHGTGLAVVDGAVPAGLAARAEVTTDGDGPGLHRTRWTVRYRGDHERSVGRATLVGPFQDPASHACTGRIVVGQQLLDALAPQMTASLADELAGTSVFGAGAFVRVDRLALRWARLDHHAEDFTLVGVAPFGYVRVTATVVFDRVSVPLVLALVPQLSDGALHFRIASRAELAFGNRAAQWLSDKIGGDALATRLARKQIDGALLETLAPPPPFELPGGARLQFTYCAGTPEIVDGAWGALPFAVALGRAAGGVRPPRRGPAPHAPIAPGAALAIDLDLDALNGLLYELWRDGVLDTRLADAGLAARFNSDPLVTEFLSIRIGAPTLALPPVLSPSPHGLALAADARIVITDGAGGEGGAATRTTGQIWGGLTFAFAPAAVEPASVDLSALELSCEARAAVGDPADGTRPVTLVPCYADLVSALRDRGDAFHGALTSAFTDLLGGVFVDRRIGASGLPADLVIRRAVPSLTTSGANASLHLDLDATLVGTK